MKSRPKAARVALFLLDYGTTFGGYYCAFRLAELAGAEGFDPLWLLAAGAVLLTQTSVHAAAIRNRIRK